MLEKRCSECGELKSLNEFHKQKASPDGHRAKCKSCRKKISLQNYIDSLNPKELKRYNRNKKRKRLLEKGKYICARCKETKPLTEFTKNSKKAHGYSYVCKSCRHEYDAKWRGTYDTYSIQKKRDELLKDNKYLCARCGEIKDIDKFSKNPSNYHGYAYVCKDCRSKYDKKWNVKRRKDPKHKLNDSISSGICHSLKGNKSGRHWEGLVGYTLNKLKKHLERQFTNEMSWDNYGKFWEIDHILPIDSFSFNRPEHFGFRICWALDNLRPLECSLNRSKRNKLIKDKQEYLVL